MNTSDMFWYWLGVAAGGVACLSANAIGGPVSAVVVIAIAPVMAIMARVAHRLVK